MRLENAFISIDQICNSWLLRRGKTIHSYYKCLALAAEAVRELALSSLPIINHKIIKRDDYGNWFELPKDLTAFVSAGIRDGEYWRPAAINRQLMPMPDIRKDGQFSSDFDNEMQDGAWHNWIGAAPEESDSGTITNGHFSPSFFSDKDYYTSTITNKGVVAINRRAFCPRADELIVNMERGIAMLPSGFSSNEIYLVYVAIGGVDTMTHIPLVAQSAIEAYINWKYIHNKRSGIREATVLKQFYDEEHRILRARLNDMGVIEVTRLLDKNYGSKIPYGYMIPDTCA